MPTQRAQQAASQPASRQTDQHAASRQLQEHTTRRCTSDLGAAFSSRDSECTHNIVSSQCQAVYVHAVLACAICPAITGSTESGDCEPSLPPPAGSCCTRLRNSWNMTMPAQRQCAYQHTVKLPADCSRRRLRKPRTVERLDWALTGCTRFSQASQSSWTSLYSPDASLSSDSPSIKAISDSGPPARLNTAVIARASVGASMALQQCVGGRAAGRQV